MPKNKTKQGKTKQNKTTHISLNTERIQFLFSAHRIFTNIHHILNHTNINTFKWIKIYNVYSQTTMELNEK